METKFTPGPWFVANSGSFLVCTLTPRIGVYADQMVQNDAEHDARLIAACPLMFEALTKFVEQWNACGPNSDFGRYFSSVRTAAVEALAKATGEQA